MGEWRCNRCGQTFEEGPCPAAEREREAQDAVIEAANALHAKMNRGEFASTADEQAGVWQAVEALREAASD